MHEFKRKALLNYQVLKICSNLHFLKLSGKIPLNRPSCVIYCHRAKNITIHLGKLSLTIDCCFCCYEAVRRLFSKQNSISLMLSFEFC